MPKHELSTPLTQYSQSRPTIGIELRAVAAVLSSSTDAADASELLAMLGLTAPRDGETDVARLWQALGRAGRAQALSGAA